jgi:osmotically-inducible protein OsmY
MKTDSELRADVMRELACDSRIDEAAIGVAVHDGVVTLMGTVPSWADKHAVERAAYRIAGVRGLANDIAIKPSWSTTLNDAQIAEAVRDALQWDVFVPDQQIRSTVSDAGTVTLTGTVGTLAEHDEAERVASSIDGVHRVVNLVAVEAPRIAECDLHATIAQALARHAAREAERVTVSIDGDIVVLTGYVDSWTERRAVVGAARGIPGVKRVDDRLHVA